MEIGLKVRITVGVVGAEALAGKMKLGGIVQAGGECICLGVAPGGVCAPSGCIEPLIALSGGIGVNGDEDDIVRAQQSVSLIDTPASFWKWDIREFGHEQLGVVAKVGQGRSYAGSNQPVPGVFPKDAVRASLAWSLSTVAVMDKLFHSWLSIKVSVSKVTLKISEYQHFNHIAENISLKILSSIKYRSINYIRK